MQRVSSIKSRRNLRKKIRENEGVKFTRVIRKYPSLNHMQRASLIKNLRNLKRKLRESKGVK
jgi:hypothetical protein